MNVSRAQRVNRVEDVGKTDPLDRRIFLRGGTGAYNPYAIPGGLRTPPRQHVHLKIVEIGRLVARDDETMLGSRTQQDLADVGIGLRRLPRPGSVAGPADVDRNAAVYLRAHFVLAGGDDDRRTGRSIDRRLDRGRAIDRPGRVGTERYDIQPLVGDRRVAGDTLC